MKSRQVIIGGLVASALLAVGPAYAQQGSNQQQGQNQSEEQITNRDVRQFMQQVERQITQMMQSGDLSRLRQWTQNNIADGAVFSGNRQLSGRGTSSAFMSFTANKQDLLRLQRFALSSMPDMGRAVQNYDLNIRVLNVEPIGNAAAIVKTRVSETHTLNLQGAQARSQPQSQSQSQSQQPTVGQRRFNDESDQDGGSRQRGSGGRAQNGLDIETQAMCTHLLQRASSDGHIQVAMGICDAQSDLPF